MFKYTKKERGAVSVFLVIILVPCMLVASIFVDVGRVSLSKSAAESASDLALNSLMTNYDFDLNDWYGMVASCQNIDEFYEASEKCFESALKSQNLSDDEITTLLGSFNTAKTDFTDAVNNNGVSYTAGTTNDIQYWKHAQDTYDGSGKYREKLNTAATEVIKQYCILEAMMECEAGNDLPDNYTETYEDIQTDVIELRSKYLDTSSHDSSDSYLALVDRLEKISADNIYNIEPDSLKLSDGKTVSSEIADISSDLTARRNVLQAYSYVLYIAINGDGDKIKSLAKLKEEAGDYSSKLKAWDSVAETTDTDVGHADTIEAGGKLESEEAEIGRAHV